MHCLCVGMMIGGYLWGGLADVIGRRPCLISAMLLNGVCGLISSFSVNFYMFLAFRLASGIGYVVRLDLLDLYNPTVSEILAIWCEGL